MCVQREIFVPHSFLTFFDGAADEMPRLLLPPFSLCLPSPPLFILFSLLTFFFLSFVAPSLLLFSSSLFIFVFFSPFVYFLSFICRPSPLSLPPFSSFSLYFLVLFYLLPFFSPFIRRSSPPSLLRFSSFSFYFRILLSLLPFFL